MNIDERLAAISAHIEALEHPPLMSPKHAARMLHVSVQTVYKYIASGELTCHLDSFGHKELKREDVLNLCQDRNI